MSCFVKSPGKSIKQEAGREGLALDGVCSSRQALPWEPRGTEQMVAMEHGLLNGSPRVGRTVDLERKLTHRRWEVCRQPPAGRSMVARAGSK